MKANFQTLILSCAILCVAVSQQDCNSTHLEYFSEYYLGRQDELNITFTKVQERCQTLNNVSWMVNDTATYTIANIKPKFFYLDSNQRADIVGQDVIVIEGGKLEVILDFQWARKGTGVGGAGVAVAHSRVLAFAVELKIKDGYMLEVLMDYDEVLFT